MKLLSFSLMILGLAYPPSRLFLRILHFQLRQLRFYRLELSHCIAFSEGAKFAFSLDNYPRITTVIDSNSLNDFLNPEFTEILEGYKNETLRVGLMGVWTEAKISYLAYDLTTRYPNFEIAICSALTAGSSRSQHYMALSQLERLLGVRVFC